MRLVVVGSVNEDLLVRVPRIPAPGETVAGGDLERAAGGKGANQAVAAARLGADVALVARVGDDASGARLLDGLAAEGVDVSSVSRGDVPTGTALIVVAPDGENTVTVAPGANVRLGPDDVRQAVRGAAGAGEVAGAGAGSGAGEGPDAGEGADAVLAVLEVPVAAVAAAFREASGLRVLNAAPPHPAAELAPALAECDVLVVNATEADALLADAAASEAVGSSAATGLAGGSAGAADAAELAAALRGLGPSCVVVTLGSDGAAWADDSGSGTVAAFPVEAVDAVGAGDTFSAALTVALAGGRRLLDAVRWACAAAALATLERTAQAGMPSAEAVEGLLAGAR